MHFVAVTCGVNSGEFRNRILAACTENKNGVVVVPLGVGGGEMNFHAPHLGGRGGGEECSCT